MDQMTVEIVDQGHTRLRNRAAGKEGERTGNRGRCECSDRNDSDRHADTDNARRMYMALQEYESKMSAVRSMHRTIEYLSTVWAKSQPSSCRHHRRPPPLLLLRPVVALSSPAAFADTLAHHRRLSPPPPSHVVPCTIVIFLQPRSTPFFHFSYQAALQFHPPGCSIALYTKAGARVSRC
jgi:hypothetical protein